MAARTEAAPETRPLPNLRSKFVPEGGFLRAASFTNFLNSAEVRDLWLLFASDRINAAIPATAGAAMLVPDLCVTPTCGTSVLVRERAAKTLRPGAQTSGFGRPSRVRPELESSDRGVPS